MLRAALSPVFASEIPSELSFVGDSLSAPNRAI